MGIALGATLRELRVDCLNMTQRELAESLEISAVHLSNLENDAASPSRDLVDRLRELSGVDIYVLAWCRHGNVKKLPRPVREAAQKLAEAMQEELNAPAKRS